MSEDGSFSIEINYVTGEELSNFITAHNENPVCPMCGHSEIVLAAESPEGPAERLAQPTTLDAARQKRLSFYGGFCDQCGFAMLFWAQKVEEWAKAQRIAASTKNKGDA